MRFPRRPVRRRPIDHPQRRDALPAVGLNGTFQRADVRPARFTGRLPAPRTSPAAPATPGRTQLEKGERRRPEDRAEDGPRPRLPLARDRDPRGRGSEPDEPCSDEERNDRIDIDTSGRRTSGRGSLPRGSSSPYPTAWPGGYRPWSEREAGAQAPIWCRVAPRNCGSTVRAAGPEPARRHRRQGNRVNPPTPSVRPCTTPKVPP